MIANPSTPSVQTDRFVHGGGRFSDSSILFVILYFCMNHEFLLGPEGQKRGFLLGDIIKQQKRGSDVLGGRRLTRRSCKFS